MKTIDRARNADKDTGNALAQITAPHFSAGLLFEGAVCTRAAPILRWAIGRNWRSIEAYCQRRHWHILIF